MLERRESCILSAATTILKSSPNKLIAEWRRSIEKRDEAAIQFRGGLASWAGRVVNPLGTVDASGGLHILYVDNVLGLIFAHHMFNVLFCCFIFQHVSFLFHAR